MGWSLLKGKMEGNGCVDEEHGVCTHQVDVKVS